MWGWSWTARHALPGKFEWWISNEYSKILPPNRCFLGVTNETHIKSGKWWQCLWSFPSVSVLLFFLAFLQGMDVIMINKTSAKSGDEFSRQMNDREAENVPVMHVTPGAFWPHAHRWEPLTLWNCYAVDCCVGAWFHARSKFEQLKRLQVLKTKMVSRSFSCFEVWMPRLFKIRYPPPQKKSENNITARNLLIFSILLLQEMTAFQ